jgi:hypothetical protein
MPLLACPLLNALMGEAVASCPIRTLRARSALWVVHAFFVRAADNPVGHDSGAGSVRLEEGQNLLTDGELLAYVQVVIGEPALEKIWVVTPSEENAHHNLGGQFVIGPIKGHGGNWVASKTRPEFPVRPRADGPLRAESLPSFLHPCNIRRASPSCRKTGWAEIARQGRSFSTATSHIASLTRR